MSTLNYRLSIMENGAFGMAQFFTESLLSFFDGSD